MQIRNFENRWAKFGSIFQCPYKKVKKIPARGYIEERINTATHLKWSLYNSNVGPYAFDNRFVEKPFKEETHFPSNGLEFYWFLFSL